MTGGWLEGRGGGLGGSGWAGSRLGCITWLGRVLRCAMRLAHFHKPTIKDDSMLLFSVWGQFTKLSAPLTLLIRTLLTNCTTYLQQLYIPLPLFIGENVDRTCLAHWTRLNILADYVNTLEAEMMTAADGQMRVSLNLAEAYIWDRQTFRAHFQRRSRYRTESHSFQDLSPFCSDRALLPAKALSIILRSWKAYLSMMSAGYNEMT